MNSVTKKNHHKKREKERVSSLSQLHAKKEEDTRKRRKKKQKWGALCADEISIEKRINRGEKKVGIEMIQSSFY
jgi:hypothetical protein